MLIATLVVTLTVGTAMAAPGGKGNGKGKGKEKVILCHKGKTIKVREAAAKKHIRRHNDTVGPCPSGA